jgi:hypothetical protein
MTTSLFSSSSSSLSSSLNGHGRLAFPLAIGLNGLLCLTDSKESLIALEIISQDSSGESIADVRYTVQCIRSSIKSD